MNEEKPSIIAKEEGDIIIVEMGGVLNSSTLPQAREMVDIIIKAHEIYKRHHLKILVDYKNVQDVDSSTIANILDRIHEHKKHNHKIVYVNVPEEFRSMIEIHKLEDQIQIFDSKKKAIEELKKPSQ